MAMVGDPPVMVGETGLGSVRIGQALGNELAGFLVVPQIMEHCQVDKPVHPPLGEPWPDMGWPVALGMAFAMALVMAFAMALVIMAFAMALVMAFAMALASSAVTWCSDLNQNNVVMKKIVACLKIKQLDNIPALASGATPARLEMVGPWWHRKCQNEFACYFTWLKDLALGSNHTGFALELALALAEEACNI